MPKQLVQLFPGKEFYGQRSTQSSFFRRVGAKDFTASQLHERIDQLYTWFFRSGDTGVCLRYMSEECLLKIRGSRKNSRRKRFEFAAAIFATRIFQWLEQTEDHSLDYRYEIASHAQSWVKMALRWSSLRYPAHYQLAAELKPRLQILFARFDAVPLVILQVPALTQGTLF